jgi:hypothetical protein
MSIDKKGFKYRVSNVVAWGGSLGAGLAIVMLVTIAYYMFNNPQSRGGEEPFFNGLAVYLGCALINYLMVGNMRLLPWRDIEDQE